MPKCPTCGGHVDWIEIENERLGTSCRVADDCPRCMPHAIYLPDPDIIVDPTSASPDPVVVRLDAEVERLSGDYAKLYGVVREYIACEKHPQMRGEAYRDLRSTYDLLSGADADQGWPACYERKCREVAELSGKAGELEARVSELTKQLALRCCAENCDKEELLQSDREQREELARLRGLLREACIGYEHNYDDASSDKRLRRVPIFHAWYERVQAALEGKL